MNVEGSARPRRRRVKRLSCEAVCFLAALTSAGAAERYAIGLNDAPGMPAAISDVAQDERGFLWVTSAEGLFRFDGSEFVRQGGTIRFDYVAAGPDGCAVAGKQDEPWYESRGAGLVPIAGPDGAEIAEVQAATFDRDGALWLVARRRALRREPAGTWSEIALPPRLTGRSAAADPRGGIIVGTREGAILRVGGAANPETLASLDGLVTQLAVGPDGAVIVNVRWGPNSGIVRLDRGRVERLMAIEGRPTGLALRGPTIWSSWDIGVFALRPGAEPERLHTIDGFPGGGHVRVDREGVLWLTSFAGDLIRFPEPDTRIYTERSGLEHALLRQVAVAGEAPWAASWGGALRRVPSSDRWERFDGGRYQLRDIVCPTRGGDVLTLGLDRPNPSSGERGTLLRLRGASVVAVADPRSPPTELRCASTPRGGLWIAYGDELLEFSPGGDPLSREALPAGVAPVAALAVEGEGALWAAGGPGALCRRDPARGWECHTPDGLPEASSLAHMSGERIWIGTLGQGVLECDRAACRPVLDADILGTREIVALVPSPRGGLWVVGRTAALRVRAETSGPVVVERIRRSEGVPRWWLTSLAEDADGTVWIAGLPGIARVPSSARPSRALAPVVLPIRLTVGGREQPLDRIARATAGDTIELRWAALSFRDPARLRYRFRLDPSLPWVDTDSPVMTLLASQTGRYSVETAAALDPESWSVATTAVVLRVLPPWFRRGWFIALLAALTVACAAAAYRIRVRQLLRLERQRTQIAMDLHDDLGATLSGVGLLASLAEEDALEADERRRILARISRQSASAASVLSDIVWSLRPGAETLDQLVLLLRERAAELYPNGSVELRVGVPEPCPRVPLSLPLRRNVQWIAVEALRNAMRHGSPRHLDLRLEPAGRVWRLTVEDDGSGLPAASPGATRRGLGLESMRRRAESVNAVLDIASGESGGTRITLLFRADGQRLSAADGGRA